VGLDAVTAYTDEVGRQLTRMEELPPPEAQAACDLVDRGCRKLKIFLDELVSGANPVPLKLFPEYELMQQARGVRAAAPTDLFYPDLSPRAPKIASGKTVTPKKLPSYLVKQRRLYQRGLLAWLRGDEEGARVMRDAVQGIEDVQTHSAQRSFWTPRRTRGSSRPAAASRACPSSRRRFPPCATRPPRSASLRCRGWPLRWPTGWTSCPADRFPKHSPWNTRRDCCSPNRRSRT